MRYFVKALSKLQGWDGQVNVLKIKAAGRFVELRQSDAAATDAYDALVRAGIAKCNAPEAQIWAKGVLAGLYIGVGCMMMLLVRADSTLSPAISSILSGICFSIGLFAVFTCEGELFTGDCLMIFGLIDRKYGLKRCICVLSSVFVANFVGATTAALIFQACGMHETLKEAIFSVSEAKMGLGTAQLLAKSVMCNFLVCLGAWINAKSASIGEKVLAAALPVTTFVALGFEHSIANVFFYFLMSVDPIWAISRLIICTFGNILGGMALFGGLQAISRGIGGKNGR